LQILYRKIIDQYQIPSSSEFDYLSLPAWIRLLTQTKEPDLIALAQAIWHENRSELAANLDFTFFESLCVTDPQLAIRFFNEMYLDQEHQFEIKDVLK